MSPVGRCNCRSAVGALQAEMKPVPGDTNAGSKVTGLRVARCQKIHTKKRLDQEPPWSRGTRARVRALLSPCSTRTARPFSPVVADRDAFWRPSWNSKTLRAGRGRCGTNQVVTVCPADMVSLTSSSSYRDAHAQVGERPVHRSDEPANSVPTNLCPWFEGGAVGLQLACEAIRIDLVLIP